MARDLVLHALMIVQTLIYICLLTITLAMKQLYCSKNEGILYILQMIVR